MSIVVAQSRPQYSSSVDALDVAVVVVRKGEIGLIAIGKACCKGAYDREQKGDVAM